MSGTAVLLATIHHMKGPHVDFAALSPLIALLGGAIVVLPAGLVGSARARQEATSLVSLIALGACLGLSIWQFHDHLSIVAGALSMDGLTIISTVILTIAGMCAVFLSRNWLASASGAPSAWGAEYHALLLTSVAGMVTLAAAQSTLAVFLGLELLSIPLYVLCASERSRRGQRREHSLESGLKYLIIGSVGSATLLYGLALIYGATGSTSFTTIAHSIQAHGMTDDVLLLTGIALVVVGLCFKSSVAPFHQWTPDVYEGAPTPITAFMAVTTKVAALAVFLRFFDVALIPDQETWAPALATLATITVMVGNVGALGQSSLKRMLAYSSVAQAGYMLAGVVVASPLGARATFFYLAGYVAMNMAAFGVIVARERQTGGGDGIDTMAGLGRSHPWLALSMTVSMLALAGVPATVGFIGKFYLIEAVVSGGYAWLGIIIVVGSMISLAYYLPVVAVMWMREAPAGAGTDSQAPPPGGPLPALAGGSPELDGIEGEAMGNGAVRTGGRHAESALIAVLAAAATIFFGIIPQPLFELVHHVGNALPGLL